MLTGTAMRADHDKAQVEGPGGSPPKKTVDPDEAPINRNSERDKIKGKQRNEVPGVMGEGVVQDECCRIDDPPA